MRVLDVVALILLAVIVLTLTLIIARQRHMLHSPGGIPVATRRNGRWLYGVGRYDGEELQWYRAIGVGTRPTRTLRRDEVRVLSRRAPLSAELSSLPANAVVVELVDRTGEITIALADGAFTGFQSWLESSSPRF